MNKLNLILFAALLAGPRAFAASCVATCAVNKGTLLSEQQFSVAGKGATLDDAVVELAARCAALATERGFTAYSLHTHGWFNTDFNIRRSCVNTDGTRPQ